MGDVVKVSSSVLDLSTVAAVAANSSSVPLSVTTVKAYVTDHISDFDYYDCDMNNVMESQEGLQKAAVAVLDLNLKSKKTLKNMFLVLPRGKNGSWLKGSVYQEDLLSTAAKEAGNRLGLTPVEMKKAAENGNVDATAELAEVQQDAVMPWKEVQNLYEEAALPSWWDVSSVKQCIILMSRMAKLIADSKDPKDTFRNGVAVYGDKVLINTGFISQADCKPIYAIGQYKKTNYSITMLHMTQGIQHIKSFGFDPADLPDQILAVTRAQEIDEAYVDYSNRGYARHCYDRKERASGSSGMGFPQFFEKLQSSVRFALAQEKLRKGFIVPIYYIEGAEVSYLIPLYLGSNMDIEHPDAAIVFGRDSAGYYEARTLFTLKDAYKNAMYYNRYMASAWLKPQEQ